MTARRSWNRCGVPPDATTYRYLVEHPDQEWTFVFRAVWRQGRLFRPATHVVIEPFDGDSDHGPEVISVLVNEWLQSLCL